MRSWAGLDPLLPGSGEGLGDPLVPTARFWASALSLPGTQQSLFPASSLQGGWRLGGGVAVGGTQGQEWEEAIPLPSLETLSASLTRILHGLLFCNKFGE